MLYSDLDDENLNNLKSTIKQRKKKIGNILSKIVPWGRSLKRIECKFILFIFYKNNNQKTKIDKNI